MRTILIIALFAACTRSTGAPPDAVAQVVDAGPADARPGVEPTPCTSSTECAYGSCCHNRADVCVAGQMANGEGSRASGLCLAYTEPEYLPLPAEQCALTGAYDDVDYGECDSYEDCIPPAQEHLRGCCAIGADGVGHCVKGIGSIYWCGVRTDMAAVGADHLCEQ